MNEQRIAEIKALIDRDLNPIRADDIDGFIGHDHAISIIQELLDATDATVDELRTEILNLNDRITGLTKENIALWIHFIAGAMTHKLLDLIADLTTWLDEPPEEKKSEFEVIRSGEYIEVVASQNSGEPLNIPEAETPSPKYSTLTEMVTALKGKEEQDKLDRETARRKQMIDWLNKNIREHIENVFRGALPVVYHEPVIDVTRPYVLADVGERLMIYYHDGKYWRTHFVLEVVCNPHCFHASFAINTIANAIEFSQNPEYIVTLNLNEKRRD